jgi:hypothetical protein
MLILYLCVRGIDVASCICVIGVSMSVVYLRARSIDVGHVFMCNGYRCWSCICVLGVSMLILYLCVRGIDVALCICV